MHPYLTAPSLIFLLIGLCLLVGLIRSGAAFGWIVALAVWCLIAFGYLG